MTARLRSYLGRLLGGLLHRVGIDPRARIHPSAQLAAGVRVDRECEIGKHTYIGRDTLICRAQIGNYCSIGEWALIGPGEHPMDAPSTSAIFLKNPWGELTGKPCVLGHDVWVGSQAIIRRGVTLGTGCVVGANAFVNRDVPPYAIVAGSPARVLRTRFSPEKIRILLDSQWWLLEPAEAERVFRGLPAE
ncbi:MAG: CatB-related O-acetyltransferase [Spirochaetes bacterium]|nr:CatB-related O-acetyltransferase [Spirochaetota bacterium]